MCGTAAKEKSEDSMCLLKQKNGIRNWAKWKGNSYQKKINMGHLLGFWKLFAFLQTIVRLPLTEFLQWE